VCCSGTCSNGSCTTPTFCGGPTASCTVNTDCCSNHCAGGSCSTQQCLDVGATCSSSSDCCTVTCTSGACATIPGSTSTCKVIGQACTSGADCCSTNCQGGVCVRAYSCQANGDVCLRDSDCCGNVCSANDGGAGVCLDITGGGGGGCIQDGNPCSGGTNCCSRVCVDPGSGATVCQPVSGCRLTGDFCLLTSTCCGGAPNNPNYSVVCRPNGGPGRCDNGQSCNPAGNICGAPHLLDGGVATYPDGGVITINASQDCCDGKKAVCRIDTGSGVPRCFGGGSTACPAGYTGQSGCCIDSNQACQFSGQCCNDALCLPGDGGFYCTTPNCSPVGATCTPSASNCCNGTQCLRTSELAGYACQNPPSGGGTDGGSTDAGTCAANGSACAAGVDCCSQICSGGVCQAPVVCQPLAGVCTSSADCCSGLGCSVPSGSTTGTCQPASCGAISQPCSTRAACCTGLNCLNASATTCTSADPYCTCHAALN
jgi:hypothetical protein